MSSVPWQSSARAKANSPSRSWKLSLSRARRLDKGCRTRDCGTKAASQGSTAVGSNQAAGDSVLTSPFR